MNISVVTTCYNEEDNIKGCLDSLTTQNYFAGQYEIIISDGNSTDNTGKIVREYADKFNNIKLVIEPKKGTAAGRNAGIRAAEYDYIAFIDADCIAPEDWLTILADNYQRGRAGSEELAAVGGRNI
ncbi:MAG: glycosyltransferase, partial [Candidatus Omnitrophica bacterium]|nr:glycosyltransferase [Candidatus Omnitrophota bacterium]